MFRFVLLPLFLVLPLLAEEIPHKAITLAMADDAPFLEEEADPFGDSEDPMGEEDPFAESDDPLAEDDPMAEGDPLADSSEHDFEAPSTPDYSSNFPTLKTKSKYRFDFGNKRIKQEGLATGSDNENENSLSFVNAFHFDTNINFDDETSYLLRYNLSFLQEYDLENKRYSDRGLLNINEGYVKFDKGEHIVTLGALLFKNGQLDFDSPSNILNPSDTDALNSFDLSNSAKPVIGGQYEQLGENHVLKVYASVLRPKTEGTEYTRYLDESKKRDANESVEDYTELGAYTGARYQYSFETIDVGFSLFNWFDTDNNITWSDNSEVQQDVNATPADANNTDAAKDQEFSQSYREEISRLLFLSVDFSTTIDAYVLKGEASYQFQKNLYSYVKQENNAKEFRTVRADVGHAALSLERAWDKLFVMGIASFKYLNNVPAGTNLLGYENRATTASHIRDIIYLQGSLLARYAVNDKLSLFGAYSHSKPVDKIAATLAVKYDFSSAHSIALTALYVDLEKHLQTGSKFNSFQYFMEYTYSF